MKYFRVVTGFELDNFITIDETELPMAMRAQITGKVGVFNEGQISGKIIQKIIPDWQKVMGYNRDYQLNGEDYQYIGEKRVNEYRNFIADTKIAVDRQLTGQKNDEKLLN